MQIDGIGMISSIARVEPVDEQFPMVTNSIILDDKEDDAIDLDVEYLLGLGMQLDMMA